MPRRKRFGQAKPKGVPSFRVLGDCLWSNETIAKQLWTYQVISGETMAKGRVRVVHDHIKHHDGIKVHAEGHTWLLVITPAEPRGCWFNYYVVR